MGQDEIIECLPALYRYARVLTRNEDDAQDLLQDTLLRAHERRATYVAGRPLRNWLFAILRNSYIDNGRRRRSEVARIDSLRVLQPDHDPGGQQYAAMLAEVAERFDTLPAAQREVLHLVAVEGLSYADAAEALEVPVGTVMSRLSRARALLREPKGFGGELRLVKEKD
ncbi:sigma-70 family RNA polymerase sigma factor [Flavisphingomonas formosensis]|uniref:sigma-70 family RNA polymerase sigma factor n=1 Tax=Flavisphingomonas formosensis TaxID=861534 RepID=UPI0012F9BCD5|nr:sigma-70 family RNA polymerase sigma factor [Sphingomonas formosensis]